MVVLQVRPGAVVYIGEADLMSTDLGSVPRTWFSDLHHV
jgi:hypothetical protein